MLKLAEVNKGKSGRPFVHSVTEKPCAQCGRVFSMADVGVRFPSHFAYVRYCSPGCKDAGYAERRAAEGRTLEALLARCQRDGATDCLIWPGKRNHKGYGEVSHRGKSVRVHRLTYELSKGPIPAGLIVMHSCDNPPCINPDHLSVGTAKDNWHDALAKGRAKMFGKSSSPTKEAGARQASR